MNEEQKSRDELGISAEDWEQTPISVRLAFMGLYHQIQQQQIEIAELREKINQNSQNSSLPPSSDRPDQEPPQQETDQSKKRKQGGQKGHRGHQRNLVAIEEVDEIIIHKPTECQGCGALLLGEDPTPRRHQVTELPPIKPYITEHQAHRLTCSCCGQVNEGQLPPEVMKSMFGPNLVGLMAVLMGVYRLSKRQVVRVLEDCFGVALSTGSVVNQQKAVSRALAEPVGDLLDYVQQSATVCYVDETGWYQRDQAKKAWLWVVVTPWLSIFTIVLSRAGQVARDLLGDTSSKKVSSDRYGAYNWLPLEQRQVCWAHLLRDFKKILQRGEDSYLIGENLRIQAEYLLVIWSRVRDETLSHDDFLAELPAIQSVVRHYLTEGTRCSHSKTAETCRRLLQVEPALWTFAHHEGLEPTNNSAERALRQAVIWRKISYGTHSADGSRFVERMLTVVETCRQQGRNPLDFIRQAIIAHRLGQAAPALLPDSLPMN